jgi:cell division protease FtsH
MLTDNLDKLKLMSEALMKYETLDAEQVRRIMSGEEPGQPESWSNDSSSKPSAPPPREGTTGPVAGTPKPASR